jgi:hypothetical protein
MDSKEFISYVEQTLHDNWEDSDSWRELEKKIKQILKHYEKCEYCFEKSSGFDISFLDDFAQNIANTDISDWICEKPRRLDGSFAKAEPTKDRKYVTKEEWSIIENLRNGKRMKLVENDSRFIEINFFNDVELQCLICGEEEYIPSLWDDDSYVELNKSIKEHDKCKTRN